MKNSLDLTGQRFGQLTVIEKVKGGWRCRCDCGNQKVIPGCHITNGRVKSCGCLRMKHGMSENRLYQIWHGMKDRCLRKDGEHYPKYGGRGIYVCDEWLNSFENFRDWSFANGYQDNLSIDRKDNDGPYSPENCRWATKKEQQRNRSTTIFVTYNGETRTLTDWAEITGIKYSTLKHRMSRGISGDALFAPLYQK